MTAKLLAPFAALLFLALAACSEAPSDDAAEPAPDTVEEPAAPAP